MSKYEDQIKRVVQEFWEKYPEIDIPNPPVDEGLITLAHWAWTKLKAAPEMPETIMLGATLDLVFRLTEWLEDFRKDVDLDEVRPKLDEAPPTLVFTDEKREELIEQKKARK